jgi:hypothetical protein
LRGELGVARSLTALHGEVEAALAEVPKIPAIVSQMRAEVAIARVDADNKIAALQRELNATKERLSKARVEQSITNYNLAELQRAQASKVEIQIETSTTLFAMRGLDPQAAETLRAFAEQCLDANDLQPIGLSPPAGSA